MKKILIGLAMMGLAAAAIYFAGRTPAEAPAPVIPVVAEKPDQLPPVPQGNFPAGNNERLQRFLASNSKGPSPIEKSGEAEWKLAAQKVKIGERQPANAKTNPTKSK